MRAVKSIKAKLLLPLIGIAVLVDVAVLLVCTLMFDRFMEHRNAESLAMTRNVIEGKINDQLRLAGQSAARIALDETFRAAFVAGRMEEVGRILRVLAAESDADICVVTDAAGRAVVRTHNDGRGDTITSYHTVREALEGRLATQVNTSPLVRLSLNGSAPVYCDGDRLVGTVTVGFRVDDNDYVDTAKSITGHEIEVFLGDECVSSTVADKSGRRAVAKRAAPAIAAVVLAGGEHIGRARIGGKDFLVRYSPFRSDGETIGMLFSGISMRGQEQAMHEFLYIGILVGLAVLLFIVVLVYRVVDSISQPIHDLTLDFERVANNGASMLVPRLAPSNVTEINILQNALGKMLEQINRGYDLQLKNKETEIEKERILAASQAKNRVFANISHEIRTPMNAILGISDILLSEGGLNAQQEEYIQTVNVSAKALLEIVNEVLDLSKLEAGKMQLKPVDYDFRRLIDNVRTLALHLVEKKGLEFDCVVEGEMPECLHGDDVRLRQILLNLIGNAVKFTKRGKVELRLKMGDDSASFSVVDSGIGIPPDRIHHLFEAFEQIDDGAVRLVKGTGLGLAICKGLAELMGGTIMGESEYGKGCTFTMTIPIVPGNPANIAPEGDNAEAAVVLDRNLRILIVDDNEINLNVAQGLIRAMYGIECDTAQSGPECLRKAERNVYDLIFMDHMMPVMDGVETAVELRKRGGHLADVPIIALTANAVNGMKDFFLENGMDGFLSKPIIKDELTKIMRTWLAREEPRPRRKTTRRLDVPAALEAIPELNIAEGVEYSAGRMDVYLKSLRILREMIPGFIERLRELAGADDLRELMIHIHGMKSSLAGVGAMDLSTEFLFWERSFLAGRFDVCRRELPRLVAQLESLGNDLAAVPLDGETPHTRTGLYNLDEELETLRASLAAYDYEAVREASKRLRQILDESDMAVNMTDILSRIEQFDYEGALTRLDEAKCAGETACKSL